MPWITVKEPWTHVESVVRSVEYQPGKHNVTAEIEAAFKARNKADGDPHHTDAESGADGAKDDGDTDSVGEGD